MSSQQRIEMNPDVLVGKPVVRGTRIAVEMVLEMIANGVSETDILRNYPGLKRDDVLACVAYALKAMKRERSAYEIYAELDLGPGGYAVAPAKSARQATRNAIHKHSTSKPTSSHRGKKK